MKSLIIVTISFLIFNSENVYICNSGTAIVYHKDLRCRGIKSCTHEIKEVSLKEAVNKYGRRACKICY
jgi:hypothetical protein